MSLFDGMENAEPGKGGVYLSEGVYPDLEVLAIKTIENRKKIRMFCVELLVHKSEGPKAMPIGTKCAWMVKSTSDQFLGTVRDFLRHSASELYKKEFPLSEIDGPTAELATGDTQPFAGVHLKAQATQIEIKSNKGNYFTKVQWSPLSVQMKS